MSPETTPILVLLTYAVLSHAAATFGKPRPLSQRTRVTNTIGTTLDMTTYLVTFLFLYPQMKYSMNNATCWLVLGPIAFGGIMHALYVTFQLYNDGWYRVKIDTYTKHTIVHGPIVKTKIAAAALDTLLHTLGLCAVIIIANVQNYVILSSVAIGYLLYNMLWEQPHKD